MIFSMVRSWDVAADLPPIDVRPLLPRERAKLLELLADLSSSDWTRATPCPGWNVHDVALHLLGNDIGRLGPPVQSEARSGKLDFMSLAGSIEQSNEDWVWTARRIPPSLLVEFLALSGPRVDAAFARLDLGAEGVAVAWTGTGPSPYWLDVAREYTERWVHHQQIRQALGRSALLGRSWLHPVLATFMRALPLAYESIPANAGTRVAVVVDGPAGGRWLLRRGDERWSLLADDGRSAASEVRIGQDVIWRLWTRLATVDEAQASIAITGDEDLGVPAASAVSVMTTKL
jgi:uncharacterized protein (TIGR03083 family)